MTALDFKSLFQGGDRAPDEVADQFDVNDGRPTINPSRSGLTLRVIMPLRPHTTVSEHGFIWL